MNRQRGWWEAEVEEAEVAVMQGRRGGFLNVGVAEY